MYIHLLLTVDCMITRPLYMHGELPVTMYIESDPVHASVDSYLCMPLYLAQVSLAGQNIVCVVIPWPLLHSELDWLDSGYFYVNSWLSAVALLRAVVAEGSYSTQGASFPSPVTSTQGAARATSSDQHSRCGLDCSRVTSTQGAAPESSDQHIGAASATSGAYNVSDAKAFSRHAIRSSWIIVIGSTKRRSTTNVEEDSPRRRFMETP